MARLLANVVVAIFIGSVLAGCLSSGTPESTSKPGSARHRAAGVPSYIGADSLPDPILKCYQAGVCNQDMTPTDKRQGNEVTIAVNPKDPKNIVGGAKDYFPDDAGECVWDGVYVTHDGGATPYHDRSFDGSPWRQANHPDPSKINYASQFWCTTDPVAYFATDGSLYYVLMAYQADRVTGSKTCKDECPNGALNDWAFNRAVQIVARSDDGGDTFKTFTPTMEGSFPVAFHDKAWLAASSDGVVHIMWNAGGPGNVYMRSTDKGATFPTQNAQFLSLGGGSGVSFLDVGPGKEVYAMWGGGSGITIRRSLDEGVSFEPAKKVQSVVSRSMPGMSDRDRRSGFPAMATDRFKDSPYAGAIYVVWQDGSKSDASDILFSASFDRGDTWTAPIILNDDFGSDGKPMPNNWQTMPAISVSPLGVIDVAWMDSRDTDQTIVKDKSGVGSCGTCVGKSFPKLDEYYTYSLDGGKTWAKNFEVRDAKDHGWDPQICRHQDGKIFIGDYAGVASSWGAAHPDWPDSRDGAQCKVYTAEIQRPIFPDAFDATKKDEIRQKLLAQKLVDADHPFLGH